MTILRSFLIFGAMAVLSGCEQTRPSTGTTVPAGGQNSTVLLNVTSDAEQDPQSVDMAMKLAGFSLDEGRTVAMFFNVKGVHFPTSAFPEDLAFQENSPLNEQLVALIKRGVDVHVCPICMKALGVEASDLIEGAKVTTRPSLFENIGPDTSVFTY